MYFLSSGVKGLTISEFQKVDQTDWNWMKLPHRKKEHISKIRLVGMRFSKIILSESEWRAFENQEARIT